jgi:hypothetical protein
MRDLLKRWWFIPSILLVMGVGTNLPGTTVGGLDTLGNFHPLSVDSTGVLNVAGGGGSSGGSGGGAVFGPDAPGATPTNPPVLNAGLGIDGKVHTLVTDNNGNQIVSLGDGGLNIPGVLTVQQSGNWNVFVTNDAGATAMQGQDGGYWLKIDGQVASGTATIGSPLLVGGSNGTNTYALRVTGDGTLVTVLRTGMSPQLPTISTLTSGVSSSVSPLGAGSCIRVTCNVAVAFRTGTAPITAVLATDNLLQTIQPEMRFCLASNESAVAFITGNDGGGECRTSVLNTP